MKRSSKDQLKVVDRRLTVNGRAFVVETPSEPTCTV